MFSTDIQTFDAVQVVFRDMHPEKHRPESRKIFVEPSPKKVYYIDDEKVRTKILEKHLDVGNFLHDNSWKGVKTLGLIQPIHPEFEVDRIESRVTAKYLCNAPRCRGHINEVMDIYIVDSAGNRYLRTPLNEVEDKLVSLQREYLLGRNQLWFVMGTHSKHPNRWMLVELHITKKEGGTEKLTKWLKLSKGPY